MLNKTQENLREMNLYNKGRKAVVKMKKACRTRWLNLDTVLCHRCIRTLDHCFKLSATSKLIQLRLGFLRKLKIPNLFEPLYLKVVASTTEQDILTRIVKFFARGSCNCLFEIAGNIRINGAIETIKSRFTA